MRLLLDTNVLLDVLMGREPFCTDARLVLLMGQLGDAELWASAKSFTDIFYIASKAVGVRQVYPAMDELIRHLSICSVDGGDIARALKARWPDFEDCVVAQSAEKTKADYIVTRDAEGFALSKTSVLSPGELLTHMRDEHGVVYEI